MFDRDNRPSFHAMEDESRYVYPNGTYGQPSPDDPKPPKPPRRKTAHVVALVAAFLAVAILFSAMTGAIVYIALKGSPLEGRFALPTVTGPTEPAGETTAPSGETEGTTATDGSQEKGPTNKNFSIGDAAAKNDPNKKTLSIIEIAALGKPAVVAINTETIVSTPFGETGTIPAAGSGFIISKDGYVVTNHHVIAGAKTISIVLNNGDNYKATLVGSDSLNDLAVLKIDGQNLPTVVLGNSADLEVGELAIAIGNPLGELSGTVTAGIISALDRAINIDGQTLYLLQTDAAINAGNSGGALFNSFGEVIGINTAKNAGTGIEGLGFAIPIDHAKPIIENLIQNGSVIGRPRIGVYTQDLDDQMATQYNLPVGVYIAQVEPGSPAEDAGLVKGDVVIATNGTETLTTASINEIKNKLSPGDSIDLTVVRDGKQIKLTVILGEEVA
jgi:serine protease Do